MKSIHQSMVEQFMRGARQLVPEKPVLPDATTRLLRAYLILEEAFETVRGLGFKLRAKDDWVADVHTDLIFIEVKPDLIEIADGCADLSVVNVGTLSACGIQDYSLLMEVDRNNLDKLARGMLRDDGKLIKPPDHKPPDIKRVLEEQCRSR